MMKLTKTQAANLNQIWTTKTAFGATDRQRTVRMTRSQAATAGYGWMNFNASSSLVAKGLARTLVTTDELLGHRVVVLVLTDKGRAALGI